MLRKTRHDSMPNGLITRDSAFTLMWWHYGGGDMVAVKLLHPADFYKSCVYCREEVAYIRRLHAMISACEADALYRVERNRSHHWVLFNRDIHLVSRREIFGRDNDFTLRVQAKVILYIAWTDFTLFFVLTDAARRAQ